MKFVCLILLLILIGLLLNYLYKRTNDFNNLRLDVRNSNQEYIAKNKFQIINLGSNHPKFGFDYSITEIKGLNLAANSQTFEYDFAVLRNFSPKLEKGSIVVIPICLLNFFLYRQSPRWLHYRYYSILPKEDIVDYSFLEMIKEYYFPLFFHPLLIKRLLRDEKKDERMDIEKNPLIGAEQLTDDAKSWISCWNKEFDINIPSINISEENRQAIQKNIMIVKQMISFCKNAGLKPVLTVLPVTSYLSSLFSEDFLRNHLYAYINESNEDGVLFLNYLNDKRFTDPKLYFNSFFFNKVGRQLFTKAFIDDLERNKLLL